MNIQNTKRLSAEFFYRKKVLTERSSSKYDKAYDKAKQPFQKFWTLKWSILNSCWHKEAQILYTSIINILSTSTNLLKDPFFTTKCLTEMIFPYKMTRTCLVILDKFHTLIFTQRVPSHRKKTQEWWIIINTGVYVSLFNVLIKKMINCSHLFLPIIQHLFNN